MFDNIGFLLYTFLMGKNNKQQISEKKWSWKIAEYISILTIILVPLYIGYSHWFPFGMPKISLFIGGSLISFIFYLLAILPKRSFISRITPIHITSFIFLSILTISAVLGIDSHNSFFGNFSFPTNLIFIYAVFIFAFVLGELIRNDNKFLFKILNVSFLTSLIVAFFSYTGTSILKLSSDFSSTIGNSSYAGAYLLFNICFGIGLFFHNKKLWSRIFYGISILFIIFCPLFFNILIWKGGVSIASIINNPLNLLGVADGAILGIVVSFIVMIILFFIFSNQKNKKIIGFSLLTIFLLGVIFVINLFSNPNSKLHKVYVEQKSDNRLVAWDIAKRSFKNNPIWGVGPSNYSYDFQKYFSTKLIDNDNTREFYFYEPHNIIWSYLSNTGILGFISYILLLLSIIFAFWHRKKDENNNIFRIVFIASIVGYFFQNLFSFDTVTTYLLLAIVLGIGVYFSDTNINIKVSDKLIFIKDAKVVIFILLSITGIILFAVLPWRESKVYGDILKFKNFKENTYLKMNVQNISLFGGVDDSAYLVSKFYDKYLYNISNKKDLPLIMDDMNASIFAIKNDLKYSPDNFKANFILGKILMLKILAFGKYDDMSGQEALYYLDKSLSLNPQNPDVYLVISQVYIFKKDYEKAREYVKKALEIAPFYNPAINMAKNLQKMNYNQEFEKYLKN